MPLSSTKFITELQFYFENFVENGQLNKYQFKSPATFSSDYITPASFIQLLFDDNWPSSYTSYKYCYRLLNRTLWTGSIRDRLGVYSQSAQYYVIDEECPIGCDSTSTNIFSLQNDDFTMLDKLLQYRLDNTSVTIANIDSTALTTNLSLMIFRYLDLKLNNNYLDYNNTILISNAEIVLEVCYEAYLIENMFLYIADKGS